MGPLQRLTCLLLLGGILLQQEICQGEKILVMSFISTKSHKLTYMPLIEELGKRGHQITVISPIKSSSSKVLKNVKEVLTLDAENIQEQFMKDKGFDLYKMKEENKQMNPFTMFHWFADSCRETYNLPHVKALLDESFDLIIMQPMMNECALGLVYRLKAPLVLFSPVGVASMLTEKFGHHLPPSFIPNVMLGLPSEMSFYERMLNFGFDMLLRLTLKYYYQPTVIDLYREQMGSDIPTIDEILGNASLILSNGHFSLHGPKPLLPDMVEIGGLHSRPAKPLPKDLEDFIKQGKEGFIYFSMGSALKGMMMSEEKRQLFLNVFSKLKLQVLWKWESETMPGLPKNVKLSKWLPQQDILGHKDIKMFITHCGGGSTEEAIYHGTPLLGFPMFGDQPLNAQLAKKHGFIVDLDWNTVTEESLLIAIEELVKNSKYRENVQTLSVIYKDQPEDPMTRAIYWVEYVMRHKGAIHLRSAGRKLNYFQYHSYDVILAYFAIIFIALYIIWKVLRLLVRILARCAFGKNKGSNVSSSKKRS